VEGEPAAGAAPAEVPWSAIEARLEAAAHYWLGTTRPDGRPHTAPIRGVWLAGAFYFYTEPQTQKARNLAAQPVAVVHLESAEEVVIVEGAVGEVPPDGAAWRAVDAALAAKYRDVRTGAGLRLGVGPRTPLVYRLQPGRARAWIGGEGMAQAHWRFA